MAHAQPNLAPAWRTVCHRDDLVARSGVVVWHDDAQVALFYMPEADQPLHAIDNHDPQSGANVIGRGLVGSLKGELVVAAPLYKQHYRLRDGQCLERPEEALRTWPVRLMGDEVQLGV